MLVRSPKSYNHWHANAFNLRQVTTQDNCTACTSAFSKVYRNCKRQESRAKRPSEKNRLEKGSKWPAPAQSNVYLLSTNFWCGG